MSNYLKQAIVAMLLLVYAPSVQTQEKLLDTILKKHAKAIGKEKRDKVKSLISFGFIDQLGTRMEVSIIQKRPNKYRMDVHLPDGRITQAFDGKTGWMLNPYVFEDTVEISGMELNQLVESAFFDGILFEAAKLNYTLSYGGEDAILHGPCHIILLKKPHGDRMKFFIDKKNFLIKRTEIRYLIDGFPIEAHSIFSDYRNIQGLTLPFLVENYNGQMATKIIIDRIRLDESVEDGLFIGPKSF